MRVRITGACQILGRTKFWTMIYNTFEFKIDDALKSFRQQRNQQKDEDKWNSGDNIRWAKEKYEVKRETKPWETRVYWWT